LPTTDGQLDQNGEEFGPAKGHCRLLMIEYRHWLNPKKNFQSPMEIVDG
jgi:hypothetical protein